MGDEREGSEVVSAENPSMNTLCTLIYRLGELQMTKGPLYPTQFTKMEILETLGRRKMEDLIYAKIRQNNTHLEGIGNESVEATFMDAFT